MTKSKIFNMENKDLIMLGLILGIALYFIGAMVSNVFDASETNLVPYKVSGFLKLVGIGILTASMVVGGIIIEKIDRNLKMLLLILGLVLLIIYTIGSPLLSWDISNFSPSGMMGSQSTSEYAYDERPTALGTPGFEILYALIAISLVILIIKIKRRQV
jgi:hypothetical protein